MFIIVRSSRAHLMRVMSESSISALQYIVDWDEQGNVNIYIKTPDQVIKSLDLEAAVRVQIIETKFKLWYF